ncbi:MAG: DUF3196 family protein [Longicatena sp.]
MDTYYEDISSKVKQLMEEEDFQSAYKILEEELSMPYIPRNMEAKLIEAYNACRSELKLNQSKVYEEEDVDAMLAGSLEEQFLAIEQLKKSNIRNHFEAIQNYLSGDVNVLVRAMLIEAMMEQNITDEFTSKVEGMDVTFSPCAIEMPMEAEGVSAAINILREWFENDNPTFTIMCVETLVKEAYMRLPFNIDEDEKEALACAIARYVFFAHEEFDAWKAFSEEKELAQYEGYELLLSTYDIL